MIGKRNRVMLGMIALSSMCLLASCGKADPKEKEAVKESNVVSENGKNEATTNIKALYELQSADIDEIVFMNFAGIYHISDKETIKEVIKSAGYIQEGDTETRRNLDPDADGNQSRYIKFRNNEKTLCTILYEADGIYVNGICLGINPPGFEDTWYLCEQCKEVTGKN